MSKIITPAFLPNPEHIREDFQLFNENLLSTYMSLSRLVLSQYVDTSSISNKIEFRVPEGYVIDCKPKRHFDALVEHVAPVDITGPVDDRENFESQTIFERLLSREESMQVQLVRAWINYGRAHYKNGNQMPNLNSSVSLIAGDECGSHKVCRMSVEAFTETLDFSILPSQNATSFDTSRIAIQK